MVLSYRVAVGVAPVPAKECPPFSRRADQPKNPDTDRRLEPEKDPTSERHRADKESGNKPRSQPGEA